MGIALARIPAWGVPMQTLTVRGLGRHLDTESQGIALVMSEKDRYQLGSDELNKVCVRVPNFFCRYWVHEVTSTGANEKSPSLKGALIIHQRVTVG